MKKKILIIGYGSIGQKHAKIFQKLNCEIKVISSQNIKEFKKINFRQIEKYSPDIIIISTTTNRHFKDLKKVDSKIKGKIILVEKPLFNKNIIYNSNKNKILIAYNLRFLPIINYIKKFCDKKKPFKCDIKCNSYLPSWRKRKYYKTSSAKKKQGGGVLNDLSHEIDLALLLFGKLNVDIVYKKKFLILKLKQMILLLLYVEIKKQ